MLSYPLSSLGSVCDIRSGYQFRKGFDDAERDGEPVNVIQIKDTLGSRFSCENLDIARIHNVERYMVKQGDVLLLTRGHRFGATVIDVPVKRTVATYYFLILTPKMPGLLDPAFLSWRLNHPSTQAALKQKAHAVHMPFLSPSEVRELMIPLPPVDIQYKIAELDALKRTEADLMTQLLEKRSLLVNALTLQMAFGQLQSQPNPTFDNVNDDSKINRRPRRHIEFDDHAE